MYALETTTLERGNVLLIAYKLHNPQLYVKKKSFSK